jgi:hypothetical protein
MSWCVSPFWTAHLLSLGYVLFITNVISGWSREQVLVYIAHLRRELRNNDIHGYCRLRVVWGRKPTKAKSTDA